MTKKRKHKPPTNISNEYSELQKSVISEITMKVMEADGIAEKWHGYNYNANDYTAIAESIFDICADHFNYISR